MKTSTIDRKAKANVSSSLCDEYYNLSDLNQARVGEHEHVDLKKTKWVTSRQKSEP